MFVIGGNAVRPRNPSPPGFREEKGSGRAPNFPQITYLSRATDTNPSHKEKKKKTRSVVLTRLNLYTATAEACDVNTNKTLRRCQTSEECSVGVSKMTEHQHASDPTRSTSTLESPKTTQQMSSSLFYLFVCLCVVFFVGGCDAEKWRWRSA